MRFLMVDRIETWEAGTHIRARKVTSVQEDYWQQTADGPAMPFGLIYESLCQAMAWLIMLGSDYRRRAALLGVREATLHRPVVPGDVLQLETTSVAIRDESAIMDGLVRVDGEVVFEALGIMCALIDTERLDDPAHMARMAHQLLGGGPVG